MTDPNGFVLSVYWADHHQPLAEIAGFGEFVCFALKMINSGKACPAALIHSITVTRSCRPEMLFQLLDSRTLTSAQED